MEDKQKEIEIQNMIEIVDKVFSSYYSGDYESGIRDFATRLIQSNVKILPEDSVVITKEELKKIIQEEYQNALKDKVVLSREEYAMLVNQYKTLEIKYSNLCDNYRLCKDANTLTDKLYELAKQRLIFTIS